MPAQLALFAPDQPTVCAGDTPDLTRYDLIVVGMSGKDAHAALHLTVDAARATGVLDRVWTVHADLGLIETPGVSYAGIYHPSNVELVAQQSAAYGIPPERHITTRRVVRDPAGRTIWHEQTLLEMVAARGMFPDPKRRWCTSDLKVSKVDAALTPLVAHLRTHLQRPVRIVNVTGLRAQESRQRAHRTPYAHRSANRHRIVDDWLPAHHLTTSEVWQLIDHSGVPYHWAYDSTPGAHDRAGTERLSCSLCIMGSRHDLILTARRRPRLTALYAEVEQRTGHRFRLDLPISRLISLAKQPGGPQPGVVLDENTAEFDALVHRVHAQLDQPVALRGGTEHTTQPSCLGCCTAPAAVTP
jgi:3'-phosphoadenosine 5'-phosphosulfate sulfotransferase (PAPS reductase)/FAD synthetase